MRDSTLELNCLFLNFYLNHFLLKALKLRKIPFWYITFFEISFKSLLTCMLKNVAKLKVEAFISMLILFKITVNVKWLITMIVKTFSLYFS